MYDQFIEVYCYNVDLLCGILFCQVGYGFCYIIGLFLCFYGGGIISGCYIGYYQLWNVCNWFCNKVFFRQFNIIGYIYLFYFFVFIDLFIFCIVYVYLDDFVMMCEFIGFVKLGLKIWIVIGGFDFSDKGMFIYCIWSEMVVFCDC